MDNSHITSQTTTDDNPAALLGIYQEICKSHQAIDDFRMKLLGLLPLTSLTGIFLLSKSDSLFGVTSSTLNTKNALVGFIAIFAEVFTLALFLYEIRGILRCHDLILKGKAIEERLKVVGQFSVCHEEHEKAKENKKHAVFNAKVAACFIYSLVFAAWIFLALHLGFGFKIPHCTITALVSGLVIGLTVNVIIDKRIAA